MIWKTYRCGRIGDSMFKKRMDGCLYLEFFCEWRCVWRCVVDWKVDLGMNVGDRWMWDENGSVSMKWWARSAHYNFIINKKVLRLFNMWQCIGSDFWIDENIIHKEVILINSTMAYTCTIHKLYETTQNNAPNEQTKKYITLLLSKGLTWSIQI